MHHYETVCFNVHEATGSVLVHEWVQENKDSHAENVDNL